MNHQHAIVRLKELQTLMATYSYEYYVLDAPSVSDAVYDGLMRELKNIEKQFPDLITPDSPTQRVGGTALDAFQKVRHSTRMLSLEDVFSQQEVESWIVRIEKLMGHAKHEFFADIKMDGLACALIYQDGVLTQAVTRGDGFVGEDVTENVRTIPSVPLRLRQQATTAVFTTGRTEVRGEIVMYKEDFEALNTQRAAASKPIFANPRNLAAGTIRQLDPRVVADRPLHFRAYDLLRDDPSDIPTNDYAYATLRALGIPANSQAGVFSRVAALMEFVRSWEEKRHGLPFNTDGIVIKVNDRSLFSTLGTVGKNPRGAVAYKYPAEEATTIIKDIVLSIGRTGAATPVAVFDPVVVAGTTVRHASLHNADEIMRKDVRIGDTVVIFKAGDIIPQVDRVITELRPTAATPFDMEQALRAQYPELTFERPAGEAVYRVRGATGPVLLVRGLQHFASKAALDIDTLGEKNVHALVAANLVRDIADIYALTKADVRQLERFGDISAGRLVEAIASSKRPELSRFIYALGIRHVGVQTAIDLSEAFQSLAALQEASLDDLMAISGVGRVVAESIIGWFADIDNQALLRKFQEYGVVPVFVSHSSGTLHGKKFVVTGTLQSLKRDEAAEKIRTRGGVFQTAIAKDTDYLVVGNGVGASKLTKAKQLGIQQIDEAAFLHLITE